MLASQTSPSKIFCRQRYSGNTLEAANLSAALTILAQRDEYQMLSPAEMTVCLPATSTPGHSHFMALKYPLLGPANCLYPTSPESFPISPGHSQSGRAIHVFYTIFWVSKLTMKSLINIQVQHWYLTLPQCWKSQGLLGS